MRHILYPKFLPYTPNSDNLEVIIKLEKCKVILLGIPSAFKITSLSVMMLYHLMSEAIHFSSQHYNRNALSSAEAPRGGGGG